MPERNLFDMYSKSSGVGVGAGNNGYGRVWLIHAVCFIGMAMPFLVGYGVQPLTNLTAEALCIVGFAVMLILQGLKKDNFKNPMGFTVALASEPSLWLSVAAAVILAIATLSQYFVYGMKHLDAYLVVAGYFVGAGIAILIGYLSSRSNESSLWLKASLAACVLGAVIAALGSLAQYFSIEGSWAGLSRVNDAGRTYGFVRQPNQQATFLNLGLVGIFALNRLGHVRWSVFLLASALLVFALVTTGSRTGLLELAFVSVWCLIFIYATRGNRLQLALAIWPLVLGALIWISLYQISQSGGADFYGAAKLTQTTSEGMGLRSSLWREAITMVGERPWFGSGILHFPALFFTGGHALQTGIMMSHSHNFFLQLAVGFGLPLMLLVTLLITAVIWRGRQHRLSIAGFAAYGSLGCVAIHSMLEFPLWYTYFLLPAGFWLGWLTRTTHLPIMVTPDLVGSGSSGAGEGFARRVSTVSPIIGLAMIALAVSMNKDFYLLTPIYAPGQRATFEQRLDDAKRTFWFNRFARFPALVEQRVTKDNYQDYLSESTELGCIMVEPWYQTETIVALAHAGQIDEAKWVMYQFWRLSRGKTERFQDALKRSNALGAPELLRFLENPQPVPRRRDSFEQTCL